jgi:hypothetical protein
MTTKTANIFTINGAIDTNKSVMQNMQTLANACGSWITYDINQGKWAVVINQAGSSIKSFTDSNIIGSINIRGTGVFELYNKVELEFPNKDILDRRDVTSFSIPNEERFPNEFDNTLNFGFDCINNPVQAELLAVRELKQSRIDKIIEFRTDFSSLGLKAGDLIDVTSTMYGFSNKLFRILSISEEDADDNQIVLNITAFEYDSSIYDTTGLERQSRTIDNGIISRCANTAIRNSEAQASVPIDLSDIAIASGLLLTFNQLIGRWQFSQAGQRVNIAATTAVITWTFIDGNDLDIRCGLVYPQVSTTNINTYVGYTGGSTPVGNYWPESTGSIGPGGFKQGEPIGTDWIVWGGDNTGSGTENVLVNLSALKAAYPNERYFIIECLGNWYGTPGINPVRLNAILYNGGTPVYDSGDYTFVNSTYTGARVANGVDVYIDSNTTDDQAIGSLMGYFLFDTLANTAQFYNNLNDISNQYS